MVGVGLDFDDPQTAMNDARRLIEGCLEKTYDVVRYSSDPVRALRDVADTLPTVLRRLDAIQRGLEP